MGKTKYDKAQEVLKVLSTEFGDIITFDKLKIGVMKYIGADELRTVKPTIQLMMATNLIKQEGSLIRILANE